MSVYSSKVAVIGAGNWGKNLVRNFEGLGSLSSIAESDLQAKFRDQPPEIPIYNDHRQIPIDQIDAVAITTTAPIHN